jgi:hypothetical protein
MYERQADVFTEELNEMADVFFWTRNRYCASVELGIFN